ncbi:MAG: ectoine/hydroxyectoine ABC transporter substrate-binding protein EhuB [Acidihalobacter sp.]|uniref:ectoine/hydroxyectoine ABC transporter substrate-binding protein EhuB n=1 Tax=Acidihalobacter sp. TaxID=1872108 RepID=UPI00307CE503
MYRNTLLKRVFGVAASAMLAFASTSVFAEGLLEKARSQGITIGVGNDIPYGYITPDGGAAGISPDVAKKVLNGMGITKIRWKGMPFGQLIPAVKSGRIDLAATSQNVLPERCKQVAFSRVNSSYGEGLLVLKGNPYKIHSYTDIKNNPQVKLGIMTGADELNFAQATGIPQSQIVLVHSNADSIPALLSHRIDALAATGLSVYEIAKKAPSKVERAEPFTQPMFHGKPTRSYGAFSMRKSDVAFLKAFNAELDKVQKTPFWANTLEHYGLSKEDVQAARAVRTADLCRGE